ncbi:transposase [Nocardia sp. NPDC059091]|uniref:IS110 family transposase n=1 Tax=unclassified Nocardia TaxID=2637762 RepID=UPI0036A91265
MTVIIGMDPHKRSATIEIIDSAGHVLAVGRYATDTVGYTEMLTAAQQFTELLWAVEGCNGIGRHLAHRLVHDGESVLDVPAKLSAKVRVFATGNGCKPTRSTAVSCRARRRARSRGSANLIAE